MQSDLFNLSMSNSFERQAFQRSFFERKYTFRFDQLLGAGIGFIVFFVMVFAWGAEHGKAVSHREMVREGVSAAKSEIVEPVVEAPVMPVVEALPQQAPATLNAPISDVAATAGIETAASVEVSTASTVSNAKYTIAHMTYVKKDQANKEIERIKAKGYNSFLIPSGKFFQLCVSGFDSRQAANEGMKALRTKGIVSSDSYIRNMPAV